MTKKVTAVIMAAILLGLVGMTFVPALGAGTTYQYDFQAVNKQKLGTVTLTKVDDLGNPLSGAAFKLACVAPSYTSTLTTPASGLLTWTALKWGDYTLTEVSVPEGYDPDLTFPKSFHIGK